MTAYSKLFDLSGREVLVIGTGGIGREVALALDALGATVHLADKDHGSMDELRAALARPGKSICLDVTDPDGVARAAAELGSLDGTVLTAATNVRKRLVDYSADEFDRVVNLNLRGSFNVIRSFGSAMAQRGHGSLVAFSSIRSSVVEPGQGPYAATKAGVNQLVKVAAAEFGPAGVRVNAVAPGVVETALTTQIRADQDWNHAYASKSALGRWATPQEIPGAVAFLLCDASTFVTGSVLAVDGGWTAIDGRFTPPFG